MKVDKENLPPHLYKIVSLKDWKTCSDNNKLPRSEADRDFIHFSSSQDQIDYVLQKYWQSKSYVLLTIDTRSIDEGEFRLEFNSKKTDRFYHLFGGDIPLSAIVDSRVFNEKKSHF